MDNLKFKTKGDSSPENKPRVFFACHPEDFSKYFSCICKDLFQAQDCAVYYIPDMYEPLEEQERAMILDRMQLVVIPITYRLLTTPNPAMDTYFPLACSKNIFVLPLMMESGLEPLYSCIHKFGNLQFLEPCSSDATRIAYEEKLKHYLQSRLISDALADQIRSAFSAYMFLSYRKKDRYHANILMRLIHSHEKFRNISIWFDEFLIPGENFDENIRKALAKSKLFALLVTPNLLENPNYVMINEYPEACRKENLAILPVEMVKTDLESLGETYPAVPKVMDCADPYDEQIFHQRLQELWEAADLPSKEDTPMRDYLIGLAYAEGIDMETDRMRGIKLIRSAAERDLPEAMQELFSRYRDGAGVDRNLQEAEIWAERYLAVSACRNGESHDNTLEAMNDLGAIRIQLGKYADALVLYEKLYSLTCRRYGKDSPDSCAVLNNRAVVHQYLGNYKQALVDLIDVCNVLCKKTTRSDRYAAMTNLAMSYGALGEYARQLELSKTAYQQACEQWGTEDPFTWFLQDNLAMAHCDAQEFQTALALAEKTLAQREAKLGQTHPDTLTSRSHLGVICRKGGLHGRALELAQLVYDQRCDTLGQVHPDTLTAMNNLAVAHLQLCHFPQAAALSAQEAELCSATLGETHPETLKSLHNLSDIYMAMGRYHEAQDLIRTAYQLRCDRLGEEHPDTLLALESYADVERKLGNFTEALRLWRHAHEISIKLHGENHPNTLKRLEKIAAVQTDIGLDYEGTERMLRSIHDRLCVAVGSDHPMIIGLLSTRVGNLSQWGKTETALKLQTQAYDLARSRLGTTDPITLEAMCDLSRLHCRLGNDAKSRRNTTAATKEFDQAIKLSRKAYELSNKFLGESHPATLDKLNALAVAIGEKGDYSKAIPIMTRVHKLRCEVLGEDHLDTLESLSNLSGMHSHRGKPDKVLKMELEVYESCCRILGQKHSTTIRYLENVAGAYSRAGQDAEALRTDQKIYDLRKEVQGVKHVDTLSALITLIGSHRHSKNYATAIELGQDALEMSRNIYGPETERTLSIMSRIAEDHYRNGDKVASLKKLEELYPLCSRALGAHHRLTADTYANLTRLRAILKR